MWKSSVRGIILNQTNFSFQGTAEADIDQISREVFTMLDHLAWFHRIPVLILASATTLVCFIRHLQCLDDLDDKKRRQFINSASRFPLWGLFHKLIGSISLLHFFDQHSLPKDMKLASPRS